MRPSDLSTRVSDPVDGTRTNQSCGSISARQAISSGRMVATNLVLLSGRVATTSVGGVAFTKVAPEAATRTTMPMYCFRFLDISHPLSSSCDPYGLASHHAARAYN